MPHHTASLVVRHSRQLRWRLLVLRKTAYGWRTEYIDYVTDGVRVDADYVSRFIAWRMTLIRT